MGNSQQEQTGETETEQTGENVPDNDLRELELAEFQKLQNKLYAVGKEANKSIVTVTGVKVTLTGLIIRMRAKVRPPESL